MSLANKYVKLHNKAQKAKKLMLSGEKSGNWHKTKRAASLLDGRLEQIKKLEQGAK